MEASWSVEFSYKSRKASFQGLVTTPTIMPKMNSVWHTDLIKDTQCNEFYAPLLSFFPKFFWMYFNIVYATLVHVIFDWSVTHAITGSWILDLTFCLIHIGEVPFKLKLIVMLCICNIIDFSYDHHFQCINYYPNHHMLSMATREKRNI